MRKFFLLLRMLIPVLTRRRALMLARCFFSRLVLRRDFPGALIVGVTARCQCCCAYCSVGGGTDHDHGAELPAPQIRAVIDAMRRMAIPKINFFGGEPLLRRDIVALTAYAAQQGLFPFIDTNGLLLNPVMIADLKVAGVAALLVNISRQETVSEPFSESMILRVMADLAPAIAVCRARRIPIVASLFMHPVLAEDPACRERIIVTCRQAGFTAVRLLLPMYCGHLTQESACVSAAAERDILRRVDDGYVYLESVLFGTHRGRRCCEAKRGKVAYISAQGIVQRCYAMPEVKGNIFTEPLESILRRMAQDDVQDDGPGCAPRNTIPESAHD